MVSSSSSHANTRPFDDLQWRGLVYGVTDPALAQRINDGSITAYIGFDPSADSLTIGHLMQLLNLRRLQLAGNRPIVLAGGATGMIGDPSFKATERALLDADTIGNNIEKISVQLAALLDFSGTNGALLVNNMEWTSQIDVVTFLRDVGKHFTVNQMIARESVRARLHDREQGISFTEFSYGLLQAYDFLHLFNTYNCELQAGASDQWGNIVGGVDLIRRTLGKTAYGMVTPLMLKADGTKFGKSESGTVWMDTARTSPFALYQFFLRTEDEVVVNYLKYLTLLDRPTIEELDALNSTSPQQRRAQQQLAREVVRLLHGDSALARAEKATDALYRESIAALDEQTLQDVVADAPSVTFDRARLGSLDVIEALVTAGLCASKSAARTAVAQGGVSLNNVRVEEVDACMSAAQLMHDKYVLLRRGKKHYAVVQFL